MYARVFGTSSLPATRLRESRPPAPLDFSIGECLKEGLFGRVSMASSEGAKLVVKDVERRLVCRKRLEQQRSLQMHNFLLVPRVLEAERLQLVSDYCPWDLARMIARGKLTEQQSQFYLAEISFALSHLHSLNIVHCNLKPSKVLLDAQGHVKVADFKLVDADVLADYGVKAAFGAPEFIAPEVLKGTEVCRGADWYSLGALVCFMLSGKAPFAAEEGNEMLTHIFQGKLSLDKSMSIKARNLITTMMRLEPAARLGASDGDGDDVRAHMFFAGADLPSLKNRLAAAPIVPEVQDDETSSSHSTSTPSTRLSAASSTSTVASQSSLKTCREPTLGKLRYVASYAAPAPSQSRTVTTPLRAPKLAANTSQLRAPNLVGSPSQGSARGFSSYMQTLLNLPLCGQPVGLPEEQVRVEIVHVRA